MSVSDPLLKKFKGLILEFRNDDKTVTDFHPKLKLFCRVLEEILHKGLKNNAWFGRTTYWTWASKIPHLKEHTRCNPMLSLAVDNVKECPKTKTDLGRSRLFLRTALNKKVFGVAVEMLMQDLSILEKWYDPLTSILANDILKEIYLSLQFQLKEINFDLQLRNASFLDVEWELPFFCEYEFVPCKELGIHYQVYDGYPVVVHVKSGSVAAEDGKVCSGDVIDELSGVCLKGCGIHKVQDVFRQNHMKPVMIALVKARVDHGKFYWPLRRLLENEGIDMSKLKCPCKFHDDKETAPAPAHTILLEDGSDLAPINSPDGKAVYRVKYLGCTYLGENGRVQQVEKAIPKVINESTEKQPVIMNVQETGVICKPSQSDSGDVEVLHNHIFPRISSCGRRVDMPKTFAYIVGETACSMSKEFYAYIFEGQTEEETKHILRAIAQGFERTLWSA